PTATTPGEPALRASVQSAARTLRSRGRLWRIGPASGGSARQTHMLRLVSPQCVQGIVLVFEAVKWGHSDHRIMGGKRDCHAHLPVPGTEIHRNAHGSVDLEP